MKEETIKNLKRQLSLGINCEFVIDVALRSANAVDFYSHCWRRVSGFEHGRSIFQAIHKAKALELQSNDYRS